MEITALIPIRLLDLGPEIEKVRKLNQGYVTIKCPGGTYRGQDKDVTQLGNPTVMLISSDIKDDLAYEITKTIFENTKEISKVHKVLKDFSIKTAFDGAYLPLHPGSYKYYQEKGMAIIGMKVATRGRMLSEWTPPPPEDQPERMRTPLPGTVTIKEALSYNMSLPVSTTIIGVDNVGQIEQNVKIASEFSPLSEHEMAAIEYKTLPIVRQGLYFRRWDLGV